MRYCFGDYLLDDKTGAVSSPIRGEELKLRPQTFALLRVLVKNYPKILPRDVLLDEVWGTEHVSAGSLPQAISELRQALGDDPHNPVYIETVHRRGYRFIKPVTVASTMVFLRPHIEEAIRKAAEKSEEPTLEIVGGDAAESAATPLARPFLVVAFAVFLSLIAVGVFWIRSQGPPSDDLLKNVAASTVSGQRAAVAVIDFYDLAQGEDSGWLSSALAQMIATELALDGSLRLLSGSTVASMTADLDLGQRALPSGSAIVQLKERLGIDRLVVGSYLRLAGDPAKLRLDLRLIDAETQQTRAIFSETANEPEMLGLVSRLGQRLHARMVETPSGGGSTLAASLGPSDHRLTQPLRLYFEAEAALQRFDPTRARTLLTEAAQLDPHAPRISGALARVLRQLGEDASARAAIARARARAFELPDEERLLIEASDAELSGDLRAALKAYGVLHERFPDSPEHILDRARIQMASGQVQTFLEELDALRQRFQNLSSRVQFDLLEAQAAEALSEFGRQAEAAERAAKIGQEIGASWIEGRARLVQARAMAHQGDLTRAVDLAEDARRLFEVPGDRHQVALALNQLAGLQFELGRLENCRQLAEEALRSSKALGNQRVMGEALGQLARQSFYSGRPGDGEDWLRQAKALYLQTGDRPGQTRMQMLEAEIRLHQGDVEAALRWATEALTVWHELGIRAEEAAVQRFRGNTLARLTRFEEALNAWGQASTLFSELGNRRGEIETSSRIAAVLTARGQLSKARERLTRALAYHRSTGSARDTARTLYDLALVDLSSGRPEQAQALLEEALQLFETIGDRLGLCFIRRKLGDTFSHMGDLLRARTSLEEAVQTCREIDHRIAEALALANLGVLAMLEGRLEEARQHAQLAREQHAAMGDVGNEATDRLLLARLALLDNDPTSAEEHTRQAAEVYATKGSPNHQALALAIHGRVLTRLGRVGEARTQIDRAEALLDAPEDLLRTFDTRLELARARVDVGDREAAVRELQDIAAQCTALGYKKLAYEAHHALFEAAPQGIRPEAESWFRAARSAGFGLIVEQVGKVVVRSGGAHSS